MGATGSLWRSLSRLSCKALYLGGQFVKTCRLGEFATGIHITLVSLFVLWIVLVRHLFAEQHPAESFGVHICKF